MIIEMLIKKDEFMSAIKENVKLCGVNKFIPILDTIMCDVKGENLITTSTDNYSRVRCRTILEQGVNEEFKFCVNGSDLLKSISIVSDDVFKMSYDENMNALEIRQTSGKTKLATISATYFPEDPKQTDEITVTFKTSDFVNMINSCKGHTTNDDMHPVMKGIYMNLSENRLEYCATNAHTLITDVILLSTNVSEPKTIIANASILDKFQNIFYRQENISVKISNDKIKIYDKNIILTSSLLDGKFPNFKVISTKPDEMLEYEINREEFIKSVRNIQIVNNATCITKIECGTDKILISSENINFGKSCIEKVSADGSGEIVFGCNYKLLENCLQTLKDDKIKMFAKTADRAIFFEDKSEPNKVVLMMPCFLN